MNFKIITLTAAICFLILLESEIIFAQERIELQTVYSITAEIYQDGYAQLIDITTLNGTISVFPSVDTRYNIRVLSFDNKELFKANLGVSFIVNYETGTLILNKTTVYPRVPYYPDAKSIAIYHLQNKILDIDLSKEFCNHNSICDLGENSYNCSSDCGAQTQPIPWFYIIIGIVVVIILIAIYFVSKKYTIKI